MDTKGERKDILYLRKGNEIKTWNSKMEKINKCERGRREQ